MSTKMGSPILIFPLLWLPFSSAYLPNSLNTKCAKLFAESSLTNQNFNVYSDTQYSNLPEDYFPQLVGASSFHSEGGRVFVEDGCKFSACNETFFNGRCFELDEGLWNFKGYIMSLNCTCYQECKCENVPQLGREECARAYIGGNGCDSCNPKYTQLHLGESGDFPVRFGENVKSIVVKGGCEAKVFSQDDFNGEQTTLQGGVYRNWRTPVQSYQCNCGENPLPRIAEPRNPNWPQLKNFPDTLDDISQLIANISHPHPGLAAAFTSIRNKRHPRTPSILFIGSTGSGKSTAINLLLKSANLSHVGDSGSTTNEILEFRIPLTVDELGIGNAELRIIDTPGLADTEGFESDARFLATLEEYLDGHDDLKNKIPNAVLIFHNFADNRYSGEGSTFVKMLRILNSFRYRITDENFSNIIFVFSHFLSESSATVKNPASKLANFKKVIEEYSLFPKPIVLVVAENRPEEQELLMQDGNYKLPNGELYPRNLMDKILLATNAVGDAVGGAVFRQAFSSGDYNITVRRMQVVDRQNSKASKYLSTLQGIALTINSTEVSQSLSAAYKNMSSQLKRKFPASATDVQRALALRNIVSRKDLPRTTIGIVKLLQALKTNEAVLFLLEKAFGLKQPAFPISTVAGGGYDVIRDAQISASPFALQPLVDSEMGYKFPSAVTHFVPSWFLKYPYFNKEFLYVLSNRDEYDRKRLEHLDLEEFVKPEDFYGRVKMGYNIQGSKEVSALKEFRKFRLSLNEEEELNAEFEDTVTTLGQFEPTNERSVERWNNFFQKYGTHLVKAVYGGGAIEVKVTTTDGTQSAEIAQTYLNYLKFLEDLSIPGLESKLNLELVNYTCSLTFFGGDKPLHVPDLTKLPMEKSSTLIKDWIKSLYFNPTILTTDIDLIPISKIAGKLNQTISAEVERVAKLYLNGGLKYTPLETLLENVRKEKEEARNRMNAIIAQNQRNEEQEQEMRKQMLEARTRANQLNWQIQTVRDGRGNWEFPTSSSEEEGIGFLVIINETHIAIVRHVVSVEFASSSEEENESGGD